MKDQDWKKLGCLFVCLVLGNVASAQTRTVTQYEVLPTTVVPSGSGAVSTLGIRGVPAGSSGEIITTDPQTGITSSVTMSVAVEVRVIEFQIPDFDPSDRFVYAYHVGLFSKNGNGNGTAYPDETGHVEFELPTHERQEPMQAYLYGVHIETGESEIFINVPDLSVNNAVGILNNLGGRRNDGSFPDVRSRMMHMARYFPPPRQGEEHSTGLHGDYLTLRDLQKQVQEQAGCYIEEDELGIFFLDYCD